MPDPVQRVELGAASGALWWWQRWWLAAAGRSLHAVPGCIAFLPAWYTCSADQRFTSASARAYSCRSFSSVAPEAMATNLDDCRSV